MSVCFVPRNMPTQIYSNLCSHSLSTPRFPLYYELKIAVVIWLLSPYTRGASLIYRKCLHPLLSSKERVRSLVLVSPSAHKSFVFLNVLLKQYVNLFIINDFSLQEIDDYIVQAKERSYETMVSFGKQGLSIAATAAVTAAVKASYFYVVLYSTTFFDCVLCD